jgi:hypothetical protein
VASLRKDAFRRVITGLGGADRGSNSWKGRVSTREDGKQAIAPYQRLQASLATPAAFALFRIQLG